jgi:hypothetical protein
MDMGVRENQENPGAEVERPDEQYENGIRK